MIKLEKELNKLLRKELVPLGFTCKNSLFIKINNNGLIFSLYPFRWNPFFSYNFGVFSIWDSFNRNAVVDLREGRTRLYNCVYKKHGKYFKERPELSFDSRILHKQLEQLRNDPKNKDPYNLDPNYRNPLYSIFAGAIEDGQFESHLYNDDLEKVVELEYHPDEINRCFQITTEHFIEFISPVNSLRDYLDLWAHSWFGGHDPFSDYRYPVDIVLREVDFLKKTLYREENFKRKDEKLISQLKYQIECLQSGNTTKIDQDLEEIKRKNIQSLESRGFKVGPILTQEELCQT